MSAASTTLSTPALALISSDRRIVHSTETFRHRYEDAEAACEHSPELELVLAGQADAAVMNAGKVSLAIEAVTDTHGRRHAMLRPSSDEGPSPLETPISAIRELLDQSPVIAWLKDLDGRYLHVNRRYTTDLDTSEERLHLHTDAELPKRETVDGPRLRYADDGLQEPLQLEYTVPAFEGRPALVALRFVMRDLEGQPVGVCGVAAPLDEAQKAREEAVRLMRVERWSRLDPAAVRAELLHEWGVDADAAGVLGIDEPTGAVAIDEHAARAERQLPELRAPRSETGSPPPELGEVRLEPGAETERAFARLEQAESELDAARARAEQAEADAAQARALSERDRAELHRELAALQSQIEELQRAADHSNIEDARDPFVAPAPVPSDAELKLAEGLVERLQQLQHDLEGARAEAERARTDAHAARVDLEAARSERERAREELERARAEAEDARAEAQAARADLEAARREREHAREEREQSRTEAEDARAEAHAARAHLEAEASEPEQAREELERARAEAEQARAEAHTAHVALDAARGDREKAEEEVVRARAEAGEARAEAHSARVDLEAARSEREQAREEREQARTEAERSRVVAAEARSAAIVAQGELEAARSGHAQATAELADKLRDQDQQIAAVRSSAALVSGLSADLERAIAAERERGDDLSEALAKLLSHLGELEA